MTVYWFTLAALCYLLWMAKALDPSLDTHPPGQLPKATTSRVFVGAAALLLIGVAALRWGVGTDFYQYVQNYDLYKTSFFEDLRSFDEPGIKGLAWVVALVRDDSAVFMAVASVLTIGLMLWTITRYSIAIAMSYLLFVFVGAWHGSFNGVRQFLAAAIILVGHRFIIQRKLIPYVIVVIIAASFHISALAMLPLYFVPNTQLRRWMLLLLAVISFAALNASDAVLALVETVKDDFEINAYMTRAINPLRIAVAIAPVLLYWSSSVRTKMDGEWFYRNMVVVHAVVMLAAAWSAYLGRFGIYTTVFLPLALPRLIDFPDRRMTFIVRLAVVTLFAVYWYVEVSGSSSLVHYRSIFDASQGGG